MAKIFGKDTYLSEKRFLFKLDGLFLVYILFIGVLTYWVFVFGFHSNQLVLGIAGGLVLLLFFTLKKPIERKLWFFNRADKGLWAEERIRSLLQKLPDVYWVIENVQIPAMKTNIDFVVIGPNGIWAVEVKSHAGNITYDGRQLLRNGKPFEKDILYQAKMEAKELSDYLASHIDRNISVHALLVFANPKAKMKFGRVPIQDVLIIGSSWLLDSITEHTTNTTHSPEQIQQIGLLLASPQTYGAMSGEGVN